MKQGEIAEIELIRLDEIDVELFFYQCRLTGRKPHALIGLPLMDGITDPPFGGIRLAKIVRSEDGEYGFQSISDQADHEGWLLDEIRYWVPFNVKGR